MRGVKRTVPLFITCQREGCENIREVRCPRYQREQKYCSRRCAALVSKNILHAEPGKGGREAGRRRQRALLERVKNLTPVEAFRVGYVRGLQSKRRQMQRKATAA